MDATPVGALYDSLLQSALRQFFDRATLDTEPTTTGSTDGRLSIDPSANPSALIIRWFGTRYTLRVPGRWAFTAHEVRWDRLREADRSAGLLDVAATATPQDDADAVRKALFAAPCQMWPQV